MNLFIESMTIFASYNSKYLPILLQAEPAQEPGRMAPRPTHLKLVSNSTFSAIELH